MLLRLLPRRRRGWIWVGLTVATAVNAVRLRRRLSGLARLPTSDDRQARADTHQYVLVRGRGVEVDDATWQAAVARAEAECLDVLDFVPGDLSLDQALGLARRIDTTTFRVAPLAAGGGALHAVLVRRDVWDRTRPTEGAENETNNETSNDRPEVIVPDQASFVRLMERLKRHAARSSDLVVAPRLHAVDQPIEERVGQRQALNPMFPSLAVAMPAARSALLAAGVVLSPGWGTAAVAAFVLEGRVVTGAGPIDPPSRPGGRAWRSMAEPLACLRSALTKGGAATADADPVESRRPIYAHLLAQGRGRFFEPQRRDCPLCGSVELAEWLRTVDWLQFKPGEFVLERCRRCGHIFQNPRLSPVGLDFYYRDAYDGLGGDWIEFAFAHSEGSYRGRVDMVRRHVAPRSWLDVGSGYGHFCLVARGALPETCFDGLDMGQGIAEGERRQWIDHGYRGMFPDLADQLGGRYDVVSMHHYLEHTTDPWAELDAANRVLSPGGHLLIEVPNPESHFGRLLGRAWMPWLQPQHLHFLSLVNLQAALESRGFSVVDVERGPAHQPNDFMSAVLLRAGALAPPPCLPWREPPSLLSRSRRAVVLGAAAPFVALGMLADRALQPLIKTRAQGWSNAYRILARRESWAGAPPPDSPDPPAAPLRKDVATLFARP